LGVMTNEINQKAIRVREFQNRHKGRIAMGQDFRRPGGKTEEGRARSGLLLFEGTNLKKRSTRQTVPHNKSLPGAGIKSGRAALTWSPGCTLDRRMEARNRCFPTQLRTRRSCEQSSGEKSPEAPQPDDSKW